MSKKQPIKRSLHMRKSFQQAIPKVTPVNLIETNEPLFFIDSQGNFIPTHGRRRTRKPQTIEAITRLLGQKN